MHKPVNQPEVQGLCTYTIFCRSQTGHLDTSHRGGYCACPSLWLREPGAKKSQSENNQRTPGRAKAGGDTFWKKRLFSEPAVPQPKEQSQRQPLPSLQFLVRRKAHPQVRVPRPPEAVLPITDEETRAGRDEVVASRGQPGRRPGSPGHPARDGSAKAALFTVPRAGPQPLLYKDLRGSLWKHGVYLCSQK